MQDLTPFGGGLHKRKAGFGSERLSGGIVSFSGGVFACKMGENSAYPFPDKFGTEVALPILGVKTIM